MSDDDGLSAAYAPPRTRSWDEPGEVEPRHPSLSWVIGLALVYVPLPFLSLASLVAILMVQKELIPTVAVFEGVLIFLVGAAWSIACYRMQRAFGRPRFALMTCVLGISSGGLLLPPLLGFGPTSPVRDR
ncbi:MAG: hypothetical protein JKY65_09185 [Planctomycetes bacterium]|nr:hypothetical protein [Planctomycetota bacterium]